MSLEKPLNPIHLDGITGKLYTWAMPPKGSLKSDAPLTVLKANNVSRVILLATDDEWFKETGQKQKTLSSVYTDAGYQVTHLPIKDGSIPTINELKSTIDVLESELKSGANVVVHCRMGRGRTSLVTAALACRLFNISAKESYEWVKKQIKGVDLNGTQIDLIEKFVKGTNATSEATPLPAEPTTSPVSTNSGYLLTAPAAPTSPSTVANFDPLISAKKERSESLRSSVKELCAQIEMATSLPNLELPFWIDSASGHTYFKAPVGLNLLEGKISTDSANGNLTVTLPAVENMDLVQFFSLHQWLEEALNSHPDKKDLIKQSIKKQLRAHVFERVISPYTGQGKLKETALQITTVQGVTKPIDAHLVDLGSMKAIACSEPSSNEKFRTSFQDFWTMVFEQESSVIWKLSESSMQDTVKDRIYWPQIGSPFKFGPLSVTCLSNKKIEDNLIQRTFKLQWGEESRLVTQFDFNGWKDHSTLKPEDFIKALNFVKDESKQAKGPLVVHCNMGHGRTGTALATLAQEMTPTDAVLYLRTLRPAKMVETETQFDLIHRVRKQIKKAEKPLV